ncbi:glycosyltransferase family 39 protein [filamentous cyanobacterium LEGE 11480]|uniref:Glycosyltransferase family 39 protein n=1 Tax=Romeriopsis navalis LEGE 11480 TaxID=2777977 RepID=A0A928VMQ5_9CYAN|nr:glycosyltransferase family 39 protein [Romeriopsis navalis]MBE9030533.1 glycosyltransferase family 39 protein [Romeriopsis navalis LEGE 11480]
MWKSLTQRLRQHPLLLILASGLMTRLFIAKFLPPGFDEAYYFLYTQNPDWSYFDHPPMVAGSTELGISLLGGEISSLSIRLGGVLLYTLTLYLLYRIGKRLFSKQAGILAVAIATIAPIFQVAFGSMTLPDGPLMVFWLASLDVATTEFFPQTGKPYRPTRRLAVLGFLVGLACLSKYHGFILGAGYVGFCLTSKPHRKALFSPWTIASFVLFAAVLFPMVYWNAQHDWASFTFQAERGVPARSFDFARFGKALNTEMLMLFPTIGIPLLWVSLKSLFQQIWRLVFGNPQLAQLDPEQQADYITTQRQRRLILWVSAPVLIGFTVIGGYRQIFPTWAMPGFFTATLLLAERASQLRWRLIKRWLIVSAAIIQVLLLIALSHIVWGIFQNPSQNQILGILPANVEQDGSIELLDIEQLRREFAKQPQLVTALKSADFIYTNRFHLSGHVGMALTPIARKPITCFDKRDMRGFAFWSTATQWLNQTGIYVTTDRFQTREDSAAEYAPYFKSWEKLGEVPLFRGGVEVDRIHVFQGTQLVKPFPRPERATQGA